MGTRFRNLLLAPVAALLIGTAAPALADGPERRAWIWDRVEDRFDRWEDRIDRRVNLGPRDRIEDRLDRIENRFDRRNGPAASRWSSRLDRRASRWERRGWRWRQ
ncbi:MAG: hypothetical protein AAGK00_00040 [Pseudomonadota bacterium]